MKVYRKTKQGFLEELDTLGSFVPKGWFRSKEKALKSKK